MGHNHKRILRHYGRPARRNRGPAPFGIVEVNPILAPVVAICDQLELPASQGMVGVDYLEVGIAKVTMRCS